ncbi:TPR domain-containing protein [Fusarium austroafricanum]|uniref:TPR domain-containing protein n=1 Tax=Fusarium austroafricanum TaxID=2364996 RepID=A0A8H4P154_9HYPO|nr:TPR domain-containing protein [Fusarium austroafricanum]
MNSFDDTTRYPKDSVNVNVNVNVNDEQRGHDSMASAKSSKLVDLDQEIHDRCYWLQKIPSEDPDRAPKLHTLAMRLIDKHHMVATSESINSAIDYLQEALDLTPLEAPTRGFRLSSLAIAYELRYQRNAAMADINAAIQLCREAVAITPDSEHSRSYRIKDLGDAYRLRNDRSGDMDDIDKAIEQYREGLGLELPNDIIRVDLAHALGLAYRARYQETATLADMNNSIQLLQEACDLTADTNSAKKARRRDLAISYQIKYLRTEKIADIDRTIWLCQDIIDHSSAEDSELARYYANLGEAYRVRHYNAGEFRDLEKSIQLLQQAVNLSGPRDPNYTEILEDLGRAYQDMFAETKAISDINAAIETRQKAIESSVLTFRQATNYQWLSRATLEKYMETGSINDLNQSIQSIEKSLERTLPEELTRASRLFELGNLYGVKYRATGAATGGAAGVKLLREVVHNGSFSLYNRVMAGKEAMSLLALPGDWQLGYDIARSLIDLVPLLTPRFLEAEDAQYVLRDIAGVACDAAAIALHAGKGPSVALEILEIGRDVMGTSIEDLRGEITSLKNKYPDEAEQFSTQRDELDKPMTDDSDSSRRYERGNKFGELIERIRQLPSFEDFLRVPSEEAMRMAATEHPIVVINASRYRCDAIIVLPDCIRSIALRDLSFERLQKQPRHRDSISDPYVLSWLWEAAMKPILDSLGFIELPTSDRNWPRVTWIPTGPLSGFPLHAAGYHEASSSEVVIDRVMSSYSSSIKAIINGRRANTSMPRMESVLVSMENTPGTTRLPFASQEVKMLHSLHVSMLLTPVSAKTKKDVVSNLAGCKIFHFAGHGFTDSQDPSRSHLLFEDNDKGDPLEVGTLLSMNLRQNPPFLAYLSACGTGQIKNNTFFDESIHLISAFRLTGFRHVIGTLWEVNDEYCIDMARITYEGIRDGGMTDDSVCRGLHRASRQLRKRCMSMHGPGRAGGQARKDQDRSVGHAVGGEGQRLSNRDILACDEDDCVPLHWVPYVHFGV